MGLAKTAKSEQTNVRFNSSSTGGSIDDSLSDADEQAKEADSQKAPRDSSQAREEAKEGKRQGRECGGSDKRILLIFFSATQTPGARATCVCLIGAAKPRCRSAFGYADPRWRRSARKLHGCSGVKTGIN